MITIKYEFKRSLKTNAGIRNQTKFSYWCISDAGQNVNACFVCFYVINPLKTKILKINSAGEARRRLEEEESYLGSVVNLQGGTDSDVKNARWKGKGLLRQPPEHLEIDLKSVPVLPYGAQTT